MNAIENVARCIYRMYYQQAMQPWGDATSMVQQMCREEAEELLSR